MVFLRSGVAAASGYFFVQGVATLGWWVVMASSLEWRRWFAFGDDGASLWAFLPADILVWCVGSLAAAWAVRRRTPWAAPLVWALCGGIAASVLHAVALAVQTRAGWLGVLVMVPALVLTVFFAWHSTRDA